MLLIYLELTGFNDGAGFITQLVDINAAEKFLQINGGVGRKSFHLKNLFADEIINLKYVRIIVAALEIEVDDT